MAVAFTLVFIALAIISIGIPVAMGIYVYNDAKQRGMSAALWTAVVLLVPSFVGLIIYIILRNDYPALNCPKCGKHVKKDYSVCPECGYFLKPCCPSCAKPLSYDWNVCPHCSNPIPEDIKIDKPVKQKKDKGLKLLLAFVIGLPILLLVVLILFCIIFTVNNTADMIYSDAPCMIDSDELAVFEDMEMSSVVIDIGGYTEKVNSVCVVFYSNGIRCFESEVFAEDYFGEAENPLIVNYFDSEVEEFNCDCITVSVYSEASDVIAFSETIPLYDDYGELDDYIELDMQDTKLVLVD